MHMHCCIFKNSFFVNYYLSKSLRLPVPSGIKPPPSAEPSIQVEQASAPTETTQRQVVAGPFKLDSSKYVA